MIPTPLANDFVTLYSSPEPQRLFAYSPGIARLKSSRLVATLDLGGPGAAEALSTFRTDKTTREAQP